MITMLFDAGNSRFKWSLVRNGRLGALQAVELTDIDGLKKRLARTPAISRTVGVCVAGSAFERRLATALKQAGHSAPEFLRSSTVAAGVRNGYREAWQLGDDRWAGAVAAWHLAGCHRSVCAISVGTALTIDMVDDAGHHRGGLIAPGPAMMLASLLDRTDGISRRASAPAGRRSRRTGPLADNTRDAIEAGCLMAAAGVVDRTISQLTHDTGIRPVVYLTGGGADSIQPLLKGPIRMCPELVLRGVAALAGVPLSGPRQPSRRRVSPRL